MVQNKEARFLWPMVYIFLKTSKRTNSVISLNWSIIDEVTTRNTTSYFLSPLCSKLLTYMQLSVEVYCKVGTHSTRVVTILTVTFGVDEV